MYIYRLAIFLFIYLSFHLYICLNPCLHLHSYPCPNLFVYLSLYVDKSHITCYGMPSHFMPFSQSWGVPKKRASTKEKNADYTNDGPRRRQAIKIACQPDRERIWSKTIFQSGKQHMCLEASEVQMAAPLAAFNESHQLLWLVDCNVLVKKKSDSTGMRRAVRVWRPNLLGKCLFPLSHPMAKVFKFDTCQVHKVHTKKLKHLHRSLGCSEGVCHFPFGRT